MKSVVSLTTVLALALAAASYAIDTRSAKSTDKTVAAKKPCCHKGAKSTTVAAKKPCCLKGAKSAKTVAGKKPCCAKGAASAKTVASKKPCCAKGAASAKTVAGKAPCPFKCGNKAGSSTAVETVMASLPGMVYRVGDFETPCSMSAAAKAEETKLPMRFVVGEKTYSDRGEATVALASLLDARAAEMAEIQFVAGKQCFKCPVSAKAAAKKAKADMKFRLAGFDFDSREKAMAVAAKVASALDGVKMTYKADGKPVSCPKSCKGKKVTYVVGDQETSCDKSAKLILAQRKIRTIVETVASSL